MSTQSSSLVKKRQRLVKSEWSGKIISVDWAHKTLKLNDYNLTRDSSLLGSNLQIPIRENFRCSDAVLASVGGVPNV